MPPETACRIAALRSAGRLTVHRGHAAATRGQRGGVRVRIDHGDEPLVSCEVSFVVSVPPKNHLVMPAPAGTRTASPMAVYRRGIGLGKRDAHDEFFDCCALSRGVQVAPSITPGLVSRDHVVVMITATTRMGDGLPR